jgi:hypothetical protein
MTGLRRHPLEYLVYPLSQVASFPRRASTRVLLSRADATSAINKYEPKQPPRQSIHCSFFGNDSSGPHEYKQLDAGVLVRAEGTGGRGDRMWIYNSYVPKVPMCRISAMQVVFAGLFAGRPGWVSRRVSRLKVPDRLVLDQWIC